MYCSQCGAKAEGKFCSQCGAPIVVPTAAGPAATPVVVAPTTHGAVALAPAQPAQPAVSPTAWEQEIRYEALLQVPEVRERIDRQAKLAPKRMSGEDFLGLCGKLTKSPVPMDKIASIAQPIYAALGIGTGKRRTEVVSAPPGRTMLRALCSLARRGQPLRSVQQAGDGCLFEATLPSDLLSFDGDLLVTVRQHGAETEVTAATRIKGQLFDWGKSRRCLDQLYADLHSDPA